MVPVEERRLSSILADEEHKDTELPAVIISSKEARRFLPTDPFLHALLLCLLCLPLDAEDESDMAVATIMKLKKFACMAML